jgi:hypothetical protein
MGPFVADAYTHEMQRIPQLEHWGEPWLGCVWLREIA